MIGIIPAAGQGVRFKELGKHYNKTTLPYKEKPILIHQIEWLESCGCDDIIVVVNHQASTIRDILQMYGKKVTITIQANRNGLSGAVYVALDTVSKDTSVMVLLGDLVVNSQISPESYDTNFISVQQVTDYNRWCMVSKVGTTIQFYDKPTERPPTDLAVSGVYFIRSSDMLHELLHVQLTDESKKIAGEFQISSVLQQIADTEVMNTIVLDIVDFGTLEEYLDNRTIKISRQFNDIVFDGGFITKQSELEREKLVKEYNWFMNLPDEIQIFTPRIFDRDLYADRAWYKMQKIKAPSLREVYLFLDSSTDTWEPIFDQMFEQLSAMEKYGRKNSFLKSVIDKTSDRVKNIEIPIENKLVNEFLLELSNITKLQRPSLMHGDYCFSNLLYDFNGHCIMIDPRGELFGDHYYDVAKICHSVMFDYDFVDAELYVMDGSSYKLYNRGKESIKDLFWAKLNSRYTKAEIQQILLITASLFLSMIPLHYHNVKNQAIYYDIFKKVYATYKEGIL